MGTCRKIATLFVLSGVVLCLTSAVASAQDLSRGNFTLQHATQWGNHTLQKGTYTYTVQKTNMLGAMVTIASANNSSQRMQMMGLQQEPEASVKGENSTLIVTHRGNSDALRGIFLAESGMEYTFPVHSNGKAAMAANSKSRQEAEVTETIPVRTSRK